MKSKLLQLITIFFLFSFLVSSCKKDDHGFDELNNEISSVIVRCPDGFLNDPQTLIDSAGVIHNDALEYLQQQYKQCLNDASSVASFVVNKSDTFMNIYYATSFPPPSIIQEDIQTLVGLSANNFYLMQKAQIDSIMSNLIDTLISQRRVNSEEAGLLIRAKSIFDINSQVSDEVALDTICSRTDRLLEIYNSINWGLENGHAVGGFLHIAKKSAEFWKNNEWNPPYESYITFKLPPWIRRWGVAQFDAAGYLKGWGKAWLWDEEESASKRIKAGISTAVDWSGFSGLIK